MFYYFDTPEIPAVTNGRLEPNDVVLLSDKGLVIIDLDDWDKVLGRWNTFTDIANTLDVDYPNWYLIASDQKEGELQDSCQSICDFAAFKKFADSIGVWNYVLIPISYDMVTAFCNSKNQLTRYWVQVLDN